MTNTTTSSSSSGRQPCPSCEHPIAGVYALTRDSSPSPGGLSICPRCGAVLIFTDALSVRLIELQEWAALDGDTQSRLSAASALVRSYRRLKGKLEH